MSQKINRRQASKIALVGMTTGAVSTSSASTRKVNSKPKVRVAGYAYDRVRAIQDGRLSLDGFDVSFATESIFSLNNRRSN